MRTLIFFLLIGLVWNSSYSQVSVSASGSNNVYNVKGDYFFKKDEFKKAIVYYNMAYKNSSSNYYSILRKAEAYELLKMYSQAEECYKIVFKDNPRIDNVYRLRYAIVLLSNNKQEESKVWLDNYNKFVEEDTKGANLISDAESRVKLYKDSTIKIITPIKKLKSESQSNQLLQTYLSNIARKSNAPVDPSKLKIANFNSAITQPTMNTAGTVMYFVSDAPNGSGGKDIYKSRLINNEWTNPENVGNAINSNGDESYPFLYNDSVLYFTSDGHGGYGGKDIFSVNLMYSEKKVVNLGNQINSKYDDYNLFLSPDGMNGYMKSERPEGAEQDIYSVAILNFKIKYSYKPRVRTNMEENKVNLLVSNGEEYNITPSDKGDYEFSFKPEENYKLVIQRENIEVLDVLDNDKLAKDKKTERFLYPEPLQVAEIIVPPGMKYEFSAGQSKIDPQYLNSLRAVSQEYQSSDESSISLSALAKELEFAEDEIYTVRFLRDETKISNYHTKEASTLFVNGTAVNVNGESFFIVLPLKAEVNFNVQTNIESIKENFSPKKFALYIDDKEVFSKTEEQDYMISMLVNTDSAQSVKPENMLTAKEISIIPGTEYLLTLSKKNILTDKEAEIYIPLTRGVKYNLSSSSESEGYKASLAEFITGRKGVEPSNEEVIDISFLSKELEVMKGEELTFNLKPVKRFGKISKIPENNTSLTLDGKNIDIKRTDKYTINVPFNLEHMLNIQTDIEYIKDNFADDAFSLSVDTMDISILSGISIDTVGLSALMRTGYLSMSVNTNSIDEVTLQNQLTAHEVSIIPGKEYILTVSKRDYRTGEETEIIVPLTRKVKYDFTSNPKSEEVYRASLDKFLKGREDIETIDGELIDISLLSKELQIQEGDEISFSLLPVKDIFKKNLNGDELKSSLYLDDNVVEFTHIQKYTINVPLSDKGAVNIQTDVEYIEENFEPGAILLDVDTISFFSEITVDTTGYGYLVADDGEITDPVYNVITVNFDLNKHDLRPGAKKTVQEEVVNLLKNDGRLYVTIKGYTDGLGDADYNYNLSKRRAETVKAYLTDRGIGDRRIRTFSFGAAQDLDEGIKWEDLSEEELEKHRRVEIKIYLPE